jgi:hypothetical protein
MVGDLFLLPANMPAPIPDDQLTTETLRVRFDKAVELIASAEAAVASPDLAARLGVAPVRLRERVDRLRDWQAQLSRQMTALDKIRTAQERVVQVNNALDEFRQKGLEAPKPYTIATLFDVLNDRDGTQRNFESLDLALKAAAEETSEAFKRREQAERDWRAANEAYRRNSDPAKAGALGRDLEDATIAVYRAQSSWRARDLERRAAALQMEAEKFSLSQGNEKVALVMGDALFSRRELEERLQELKERRENLLALTAAARLSIEETAQRLTEAKIDRDKNVGDQATARARVEAVERELEVSQQRLSLLEDQLERVPALEELWRRIHAVLQAEDKEKWGEWRREADNLLRSLERERNVHLINQNNLRGRLIERQSELDALVTQGGSAISGEGFWKSERLRALDRLNTYLTENLFDIERTATVARRFVDLLTLGAGKISWRDRWRQFANWSARWWGYELYPIGDSPITVKKRPLP